MVEYRVGESGATVLDERGHIAGWLRPGLLVIPGTADMPSFDEPIRLPWKGPGKPIRYSDKVVRPKRGPAS